MLLVVLTSLAIIATGAKGSDSNATETDDLLVNVTSGQLRGSYMQSENGSRFYAYRGIPYAQPPTSQLRFESPVAKEPWNGTWDASMDGPRCLQDNIITKKLQGKEDCLYLNVYTPLPPSERTRDKRLPVIFYIHGGGNIIGSGISEDVGPKMMMDHDVVLVAINYRLADFGFLSTEDEVAPGDYAYLDQILALEWVRDNVEEFGGDPNSVTIAGTSAGSWSVLFHMISPLSKGLFHGAIAQSGSPFGRFGSWYDPKKALNESASLVNCQKNSNQATIDCIRKHSALEIIKKRSGSEDAMDGLLHLKFHAVVDAERGREAFLPKDPYQMLLDGSTVNKVPLIIGVTKDEGGFLYFIMAKKSNATGRKHVEEALPLVLQNALGLSKEEGQELKEEVKKEYGITDTDTEEEITDKLIRIYSDLTFDYSVDETSRKLAQLGIPVFTYRFTHFRGNQDLFGLNVSTNHTTNIVNHGDDMLYVFNIDYLKLNFTQVDKKVSNLLLQLWTSFAKNSVPTADDLETPWQPLNLEDPTYLDINSQPTLMHGPLSPHTDFWIEKMDKIRGMTLHNN